MNEPLIHLENGVITKSRNLDVISLLFSNWSTNLILLDISKWFELDKCSL